MGDVLTFRGITCVDEPPEQVLEKAKGWGNAGMIMLMLEAARLDIIKRAFE